VTSGGGLGANIVERGVRFVVWAPDAPRVSVEIDGQLTPMARGQDGVWSALVLGAEAGARYRYRLNEGAFPDPYSRSQPDGPHGASEVIDPRAFRWTDQAWRGLEIEGLCIYQVHVGTATREGTFDALIEQLPRLTELGVSAIEPLPVVEFPGRWNWGYDGVDLFAPAHVYGGPTGLKAFVDAAHQHGLGVILDVVYNHLGPDGNYLRAYCKDYFTDRYHTPWGDAINYDGPRCEHVRQLVVDNARYWVDEYHVDGFRLDATHAIFDRSKPHILAELSSTLRASTDRSLVLIAETHENDVRYVEPVVQEGFGMDAVWADEFHHILRRYLAGDHEGYFARYQGTLDELARCIERGWVHGTPTESCEPWNFVYVIQNHDQVGNRAFGDRLNHQIDLDRYLAASALLLFLPRTPMLFMGQEFAASSPFQYFTDHNPELGRLVTEGRRREFKAFSAFADPAVRQNIPDPQSADTFQRSKLPLDERDKAPGREVEAIYRELLRLRREDRVLRVQARGRHEARAPRPDVLTVRRWSGESERLIVTNFGDAPFALSDDWRQLLRAGCSTIYARGDA
jgi:maltooligosyltrehalose trehalohydrolase